MRRSLGAPIRAAFAAALLLCAVALSAQGVAAAPWYSNGLRKLGFTVFDKPAGIGDFAAQALGGERVRLDGLRGKVVLLNFWATWCPPCREEMPALEGLWKKTKDKDFAIMGISLGEDPGAVKDFIAKNGYTYPIYVDPSGSIGGSLNVRSIPTTYVLGKDGKAIARKVGGAPYDGPASLALFAELASR